MARLGQLNKVSSMLVPLDHPRPQTPCCPSIREYRHTYWLALSLDKTISYVLATMSRPTISRLQTPRPSQLPLSSDPMVSLYG